MCMFRPTTTTTTKNPQRQFRLFLLVTACDIDGLDTQLIASSYFKPIEIVCFSRTRNPVYFSVFNVSKR